MGRWVTSKGRRIYIPDEGEENPFAKGGSAASIVADAMIRAQKEEERREAGRKAAKKEHDEVLKLASEIAKKTGVKELQKFVIDEDAGKKKQMATAKKEARQAASAEKKSEMKRSLVSLSTSTLKRMYKNAPSDEEKKKIGAELNSRGYYGGTTKKWKSIGGGR